MTNSNSTSTDPGNHLPRKWFPLWRLDSYILIEFLIKYAILLLVFTILFVLNDVYQDISDFLNAKASWREIGLYLLCKTPGNLRFILPISVLLGCMWTMATFGKNLEITAMRASGVSLPRCGAAIFAVGLLMTGVNVYFNEILVPKSSVMAERIYDHGADKRRHAKSLLTYKSDDKERRWLFQLFDGGTSYQNVTLKTVWSSYLIEQLIYRHPDKVRDAMLQKIIAPHYAEYSKLTPDKQRKQLEKLLLGRKIDFLIKRADYNEEKSEWVFTSGTFVSYDRIEESRFKGSSGTSAMHWDIKFQNLRMPKSEIEETPEDIINAVKEKDDLSTPAIWRVIRRNPNMPARAKCIYLTVFFYRIAFPWACFLAVFLGVPLATKNERTGSMLAIVSAIVLIVIYMIVAQFFLMLGKSGIIPPVLAGLAPTIAFIGAGCYRMFKDRT